MASDICLTKGCNGKRIPTRGRCGSCDWKRQKANDERRRLKGNPFIAPFGASTEWLKKPIRTASEQTTNK